MSNNVPESSWFRQTEIVPHPTIPRIQTLTPFTQTSIEIYNFNNFSLIYQIKYWVFAPLVFLIVRKLVERFICLPIGKKLGIENKRKLGRRFHQKLSTKNVSVLKEAYLLDKKWNKDKIYKLSKITKCATGDIAKWLWQKRASDKPTNLTKFEEACWKFISHVVSMTLGLYVLWDKPCFWDITECWINYPNSNVPNEIWWFYFYAVGLYGGSLLTQAYDVRRRDFREMIMHHVVTLILFVLTWIFCVSQIGSIGILLHDVGDVFLQAMKLAACFKRKDLARNFFLVFAVVWCITRLVVYPKIFIIDVWNKATLMMNAIQPVGYYMVLGFIVCLFCLHLFWTSFIIKALIAVMQGDTKNERDTRSSTETEDVS